ncbi:Cof-type HAD-IIB family hydrolase [Ureaplasma canigenitalium]|uniref:Cof-type HAD-IIB family hydrolase n=1 Tax=Ureaplasma canigenitalium TaxID=42092 RepID=UPI0004E1514F|nr:Cof-type HAD-IIB family hydrolase [Ureaplasma canigenitalium]
MNTRFNKFLITCDLDGTLLDSEGKLSEKTIQGVKKLVEDGHIFCIVTGRPIRGALHVYEQLGLKTLMANYNGAYISNPTDINFTPINMPFSKNIVKAILCDPYISKNISNAVVEANNEARLLNDHMDPVIWKSFRDIFHVKMEEGGNLSHNLENKIENIKDDVNALLLNVDSKSLFDTMVYHIKQIAPTLAVRSWSTSSADTVEVIEINSAFADKAMAMRYLSSYYGIPLDRCISFGDGENDLTMLNQAGYGFAMKNGTRSAKLMARHITKHTNQENGVIWELDYVLKEIYERNCIK